MPALGKADGSIVIEALMDTGSAERGLKKIKSGANSLSASLKKIGGIIGTVFAAKSIVAFGKECVELGSNVAEVQNVVDVAFGDMTDKVEDFANSAIRNFGMSQLAAKKTASTYMAMAKGMNIPEEAAADMSITLAGLTGDIASFYNISQELADTKLKSVFTGETETLKDLGVVMTQANLKAYALNQGITKSIDSMTQAELVGLRYNFVVDQLALAQGDFARTSNSWANQTRILSMQWQELMSIIGQSLIQVLTPLVKVLNDVVASMITAAQTASTFVNALFGGSDKQMAATGSAASAVASEIGESVDNQNALTDATKATEKAQKGVLAGFDEINTLADTSSSGSGAGGGVVALDPSAITAAAAESAQAVEESGLAAAIAKLQNAVDPFRESFLGAISDIQTGAERLMGVFDSIWEDLGTLGEPLEQWASGPLVNLINQIIMTIGSTFGGLLDSVGLVLGDLWDIAIYPVIQKWTDDILPAMTEFVTEFLGTFDVLFEEIKEIFDRIWSEAIAPALEIVQGIWEDAWDSMLAAWEKWGSPIFEKIREAIRKASDYLQKIWETVVLPVWDTIMSVVDELWTEHLKPLWDNILDFIGMLVDGAFDIYNSFILPVANWFTDIFGGKISDTISNIIERFGNFLGVVSDAANFIVSVLKGVLNFLIGVFTGDWERAFSDIAKILKGVINGMIGFVEGFVNIFIRGINTVINAANSLSFDVPDWVPLIGGETWGFDIQTLKEIKLPRLATGAVIPPNREFLAVLGDQSSGTNIEASLSTTEQALENVLNRRGNSGEQTAVMECDKIQFGKLIYKLGKSETARHGVSLTEVKG